MSDFFDIYNLLILALAVAIFLRLRSVLGRRTGSERPPFDPYAARERSEPAADTGRDNVVALPRTGMGAEAPPPQVDATERVSKVADENSPIFGKLKALVEADPSFDPKSFLDGAKMAYEMIVTAFAAGDRRSLRPLLSDEVYQGFDRAIEDREQKGEQISSTLIGIDKARITDAVLKGSQSQVTVRFQSQMISATYGKDGALIDGDPKKVLEVIDVWTFARDVRSQDPNWRLVATEAG